MEIDSERLIFRRSENQEQLRNSSFIKILWSTLLFLIAVVTLNLMIFGQSNKTRALVPVYILGRDGNFVVGLPKNNFTIKVNSKQINDFQLVHNPHLPMAVCLIFDHSASEVIKHLNWIKQISEGFSGIVEFEDQYSVLTYGFARAIIVQPSSDWVQIISELSNLNRNYFSNNENFLKNFPISDLNELLPNFTPAEKIDNALREGIRLLNQSGCSKKALILITSDTLKLSDSTFQMLGISGVPTMWLYFPSSIDESETYKLNIQKMKDDIKKAGGWSWVMSADILPPSVGKQLATMIKYSYIIDLSTSVESSTTISLPIEVKLKGGDFQLIYRKELWTAAK